MIYDVRPLAGRCRLPLLISRCGNHTSAGSFTRTNCVASLKRSRSLSKSPAPPTSHFSITPSGRGGRGAVLDPCRMERRPSPFTVFKRHPSFHQRAQSTPSICMVLRRPPAPLRFLHLPILFPLSPSLDAARFQNFSRRLARPTVAILYRHLPLLI